MAAHQIIIEFILTKLNSSTTPLFIGLQGPQGIGKTTISNQIKEELKKNHKINTIVISIDDFYLTRKEQINLEEKIEPFNPLLKGRGLPGTHDLHLAKKTLFNLKNINFNKFIELPIYDKSIQNGLGDRIGFKKIKINLNDDEFIHLIILEGWMIGFLPIDSNLLKLKFNKIKNLNLNLNFELNHLIKINQNLFHYLTSIWSFLDFFILLSPLDFNFIWSWRLEQENHMKSRNGGIGMSEEGVEKFISRYMPCYELFGKTNNDEEEDEKLDDNEKEKEEKEEGIKDKIKWSMMIIFDKDRKIVNVKTY